MSGNGYLTTAEVAEVLGLTRIRIVQMGREGKLSDTGKTRWKAKLWHRAEVEALKLEREALAAGICGRCGCIEDVSGGLCWICRLEERQPWHERLPSRRRASAVRRGRLSME